jgi:hypothetical protein
MAKNKKEAEIIKFEDEKVEEIILEEENEYEEIEEELEDEDESEEYDDEESDDDYYEEDEEEELEDDEELEDEEYSYIVNLTNKPITILNIGEYVSTRGSKEKERLLKISVLGYTDSSGFASISNIKKRVLEGNAGVQEMLRNGKIKLVTATQRNDILEKIKFQRQMLARQGVDDPYKISTMEKLQKGRLNEVNPLIEKDRGFQSEEFPEVKIGGNKFSFSNEYSRIGNSGGQMSSFQDFFKR